ncbi:hypothetical protein OAT77_01460 [Alphaproteobacteria bacterium]|nr:hypothetical protein [Alphaproteobacteria bacterium]
MSDTVISFTTIEFPNEELMKKMRDILHEEMTSLAEKLRPEGMIRFHSSRLFLPEDKLMFGNWLEYRDMEAFKACDAIWQKNGEEFFEKYGELYVDVKFTSYRGQVIQDWT